MVAEWYGWLLDFASYTLQLSHVLHLSRARRGDRGSRHAAQY